MFLRSITSIFFFITPYFILNSGIVAAFISENSLIIVALTTENSRIVRNYKHTNRAISPVKLPHLTASVYGTVIVFSLFKILAKKNRKQQQQQKQQHS